MAAADASTPIPPVLKISLLAWEKIWHITNNFKGPGGSAYECSSLGIMHPTDPLYLLDIVIPKQVNSGGTTDMEDNDINAILMSLVSQGVSAHQLACWHHTHADFGTFLSSTDKDTIDKFKADTMSWSIVTNTKGDILVQGNLFTPVRWTWPNCKYEIIYPKIDLSGWWAEVSPKMTVHEVVKIKASPYRRGKDTDIDSFINEYRRLRDSEINDDGPFNPRQLMLDPPDDKDTINRVIYGNNKKKTRPHKRKPSLPLRDLPQAERDALNDAATSLPKVVSAKTLIDFFYSRHMANLRDLRFLKDLETPEDIVEELSWIIADVHQVIRFPGSDRLTTGFAKPPIIDRPLPEMRIAVQECESQLRNYAKENGIRMIESNV